jgi:hypothetical protein
VNGSWRSKCHEAYTKNECDAKGNLAFQMSGSLREEVARTIRCAAQNQQASSIGKATRTPPIEFHDGRHPDSSREISGNNIRRIMHAEIDPRQTYAENQ